MTGALEEQMKTVAELAEEVALLREDAVRLDHMIEKFKV